jgi:hypothetical protein
MRNYKTKQTFLGIDAPEKSSKRSLQSSLVRVFTIVQSKESKERLSWQANQHNGCLSSKCDKF